MEKIERERGEEGVRQRRGSGDWREKKERERERERDEKTLDQEKIKQKNKEVAINTIEFFFSQKPQKLKKMN